MAFKDMFEQLSEENISTVLSYSPVPENDKPRARVIGMDQLIDIAESQYTNVRLIKVEGLQHSKFNNLSKNAPAVEQAEVMIVASNS